MTASNGDVTNMEILEAINDFSTHVDTQLADMKMTVATKEYVDARLKKIESTMVTKDYLDEKLADLRGDLTVLMRKEDTKLKSLITLLENKRIISAEEAKQIYTMEPFPQFSL